MATSSPSSPLAELVPLSAYETVRARSLARVSLAFAVFWFVGMTITQVAQHEGRLGQILVTNALGALLCGILFLIGMRWYMARVTRQLYDGTSPWLVPPPAGQYDARLACSMMRGRVAVGGHLYVGRDAWVFVPHTKNFGVHREPWRWERPDRISLSTEPVRSVWLNLMVGKVPDRLVVSADGASRQFVVPNAQLVLTALQKTMGRQVG